MTAFSHIVSLGYRCRTTQRLREHFGFKTAFPFDWWITPAASGANVLRDWDVERLYEPAQLKPIHRWGRTLYIEHIGYGLRFQHEFPMDLKRQHVLPGWHSHIAQAKSRTAHLMQKLDLLDRPDRKVLWVRELMPGEEVMPAALAALRLAAHDRAPRAQSSFLLISASGAEAPGWQALKIDDPVREPWAGTPAIWDAALGSLGYGFERRPGWGEPEG
ncbi:MAG TPA: hypothetical protein VHX64_07195 [Caulobacteraceae bacterium]|nr:hypothetical protein [Caulobacteraceae bacterium]